LTFSIDKKLRCRIVGINENRSCLSFTSFPIPVRKDMKRFCFFVPVRTIEVKAIFRKSCQVYRSKIRTMRRPFFIVWSGFSQIIKACPNKFSYGIR
jgi:hypothetical protein